MLCFIIYKAYLFGFKDLYTHLTLVHALRSKQHERCESIIHSIFESAFADPNQGFRVVLSLALCIDFILRLSDLVRCPFFLTITAQY